MTTREIIDKYFETVNARNWDEWITLFAEDIVFDDAISGRISGLAEMKKSVEGTDGAFESFSNNPEEIVTEGDKGMVVCRIEGKTRTGRSLSSPGANFYRIENGKIAYMSSFHDPSPFIKAFS